MAELPPFHYLLVILGIAIILFLDRLLEHRASKRLDKLIDLIDRDPNIRMMVREKIKEIIREEAKKITQKRKKKWFLR